MKKKRIITWGKKISRALKGNKKLISSIKRKWKDKKYRKKNGRAISKALTGRIRSKRECEAMRRGNTLHKNPMWKDNWNKLTYIGKHRRIRILWGKADRCENRRCEGRTENYEWANMSGKYKESRKDWKRLCWICHKAYDTYKRLFGRK